MEFDKYLEFLHKVHEGIYLYKQDNSWLEDKKIVKMALPYSEFFQNNFGDDFEKLSPEYQKKYQDNIESIFRYKSRDAFGEHNLIEDSGGVGAVRRLFEKMAKDEYQKLHDHDPKKLHKESYSEFIESIKKNGGMFGDHMKINDFENSYERLKNYPLEKIEEAIKMRQEQKQIHEELREIIFEDKVKKLKEVYPERFEGNPALEKDTKFINELMHELAQKDYEKFRQVDDFPKNNQKYDKLNKESIEKAHEYYRKVPEIIDQYLDDSKYFRNKPNGTEFPYLEKDGKGNIIKVPSSCECDINISIDAAFKGAEKGGKDILSAFAKNVSISDDYSNKGFTGKPKGVELV